MAGETRSNQADDDTVPLKLYSAALDEIWHLRRALAYEAGVADAHGGYKSFPKSRRKYLEEQAARMRLSAAGHVEVAYAGTAYYALDAGCKAAGIPTTMTRWSWEAGLPQARSRSTS